MRQRSPTISLTICPLALLRVRWPQAITCPAQVIGAILIGVDLGPNLSLTGSLATVLWLVALRRDKIEIGAWPFLRLGLLVMPPALIVTLAAVIL